MKLSQESMQCISAFDRMTGVLPKACMNEKKTIVFFIQKDEMGKAIGKNGKNAKEFSEKTGKKTVLLAYSDNAAEMLHETFPESEITEEEGQIRIRIADGEKFRGESINPLKKFLEEKTGKKI